MMEGLYLVLVTLFLTKVCVPVLGAGCDDQQAVMAEVQACLQEVQATLTQQMQNIQQQPEQLTAYCANVAPGLVDKLENECKAPYADCPDDVAGMMDRMLEPAKTTIASTCQTNSTGVDGECTGKIMGCMTDLMTHIREQGMDPQQVLGGLGGQNSNMDQEQLCSVIGDTDFGSIMSCLLSAQAECDGGAGEPDPSGPQMEMAIKSMKYMCTEECKNLEKKMNDTNQCLPMVMQPFMGGELPEDKHEEACTNMTTGLRKCVAKSSGCCQTVLMGVKMGLEAAVSQGPMASLTNVCPALMTAFDGVCEGGEGSSEEVDGSEDEDGDDTNSGLSVLPVIGWLLVALMAQLV